MAETLTEGSGDMFLSPCTIAEAHTTQKVSILVPEEVFVSCVLLFFLLSFLAIFQGKFDVTCGVPPEDVAG